MGTTYKELIRQTMLKLHPKVDGATRLAVEQAINEAHRNIARVRDFDELMVLDTTNAVTVANKKLYHIISDLNLVRPKDIYTIRYMDAENSRKLEYVPVRELDNRIPYTETVGTGRPKYYTRRGMYIELFCIPDSAKSLCILHSQWPALLSNEADETPYLYLDDVIVTLAAEIALSILEGGIGGNWFQRAQILLGVILREEETRPDNFYIARPFSAKDVGYVGKYWLSPWVKKQPE